MKSCVFDNEEFLEEILKLAKEQLTYKTKNKQFFIHVLSLQPFFLISQKYISNSLCFFKIIYF